MKHAFLAAASGLALSAFLTGAALAQASGTPPVNGATHTDANGMPTDHSTPAERAQTADLNNQISANNQAADAQAEANNAQYQQQQQQYQNTLQENQAAQAKYADDAARYNALRERYRAERAAYHRGIWPDRYVHWVLEAPGTSLIGARVEIINGDHVGTVREVAHNANRTVAGLLVRLDDGPMVWIDAADVRYNTGEGIVMTNLDAHDLHLMAEERL
jgi:hypothetical protein